MSPNSTLLYRPIKCSSIHVQTPSQQVYRYALCPFVCVCVWKTAQSRKPENIMEVGEEKEKLIEKFRTFLRNVRIFCVLQLARERQTPAKLAFAQRKHSIFSGICIFTIDEHKINREKPNEKSKPKESASCPLTWIRLSIIRNFFASMGYEIGNEKNKKKSYSDGKTDRKKQRSANLYWWKT